MHSNIASLPEDDWLLHSMVRAAPTTIAFVIVVFNFIGHFGNFNLIFATFRSKALQTKHGYLLVLLCSEHSCCLLGELINAYIALSGTHVTRRTCLTVLSPYICVNLLQSSTVVMVALDVLVSCVNVTRYRKWRTSHYLSVIIVILLIFPASFMMVVWSRVSDEIVFLCNPPLAMDPRTANLWGGSVFLCNVCILLIYGYVYFYAYGKHKESRRHTKRVMRSLTILVLVFTFSWFTCMGLVFLVDYFTSNELIIILIRSYAVFFGVIAFSQTFYVYYIRSDMYRREFKRQMCCPKKEKDTITIFVSRTS